MTTLVTGTATSPQTSAGGTVCNHYNCLNQCDDWGYREQAYAQWVTAVATCPNGTVPLNGRASAQAPAYEKLAVTDSGISTSSGDVPTSATEASSLRATMTDIAVPTSEWTVVVRVLCLATS